MLRFYTREYDEQFNNIRILKDERYTYKSEQFHINHDCEID